MKSAENQSSLINFTDYLSAKYDADSINITHSVIDDEVHLKISVTNSKTPSRLTLVNKNTNNFKVIADISCDIDGPIASTIRSSTIQNPIYGYDALNEKEVNYKNNDALAVMAVSNLPCELP